MRKLSRMARIRLATAAVIVAVVTWWVWPPGRPFEPAQWHAQQPGGPYVRAAMADRMIAGGELLGKTREQVIAMLGEPESYSGNDPQHLSFHLGPERQLFSIDTESLRIHFGPDGQAVRAWISSN